MSIMNLRLEILALPRGTQKRLVAQTGLAKITIIRALHARRCGVKAAKLIASAVGSPDRWPELIPPAKAA